MTWVARLRIIESRPRDLEAILEHETDLSSAKELYQGAQESERLLLEPLRPFGLFVNPGWRHEPS
jgi:hypothetical protein